MAKRVALDERVLAPHPALSGRSTRSRPRTRDRTIATEAVRSLGHEKEALITLRRAIILIVSIVITTLALLYLWQSWQLAHLNAQLQVHRAILEKLKDQNELLQFKIEQAFSLERIERVAKEKLEMVEPSLKYLTLPPREGKDTTSR